MKKFILFLIFFIWTLIHIYFLQINQVLKVADSFAYLQMSNYFNNFSLSWFWNWWFGFLYSFFIAIFDFFIKNNFLSAQILNIILFNFSWFLVYKIAKDYLKQSYLYILLILFFLSPILLHFNIAILSENIYLPLFLLLVLWLKNFIFEPRISDWIALAFLIALMYFTRWEAFIYLWAIWLISLILTFSKKISFKKFLWFNIILILFFGIFVSPYVYYLHSFTWEWGLSDKWSSNLRQAIMRWKEQMDDSWFEKAVGELTPDSKHLMAGFAWWLKYEKPYQEISLKDYILKDKKLFFDNWLENQKKLYSNNILNIIDSNVRTLYFNVDSSLFYQNNLFLFLLFLPIILFFNGIYYLYKNKKTDILIIFFSFFIIASIFFTLFFVLNRYFIIFIPLFLIIIIYWIQNLDKTFSFSWTWFTKKSIDSSKISGHRILKFFMILNFIWLYLLWLLSYYNTFKDSDEKYKIKKIAGQWLKNNSKHYINKDNFKINILERFPIVTYYSKTNNRFITPYTDSLTKLLIYAKYNKIDYLVVDSLDFEKYRPQLDFLLYENKQFDWLEKIKVFSRIFDKKIQKVIIYKIKK